MSDNRRHHGRRGLSLPRSDSSSIASSPRDSLQSQRSARISPERGRETGTHTPEGEKNDAAGTTTTVIVVPPLPLKQPLPSKPRKLLAKDIKAAGAPLKYPPKKAKVSKYQEVLETANKRIKELNERVQSTHEAYSNFHETATTAVNQGYKDMKDVHKLLEKAHGENAKLEHKLTEANMKNAQLQNEVKNLGGQVKSLGGQLDKAANSAQRWERKKAELVAEIKQLKRGSSGKQSSAMTAEERSALRVIEFREKQQIKRDAEREKKKDDMDIKSSRLQSLGVSIGNSSGQFSYPRRSPFQFGDHEYESEQYSSRHSRSSRGRSPSRGRSSRGRSPSRGRSRRRRSPSPYYDRSRSRRRHSPSPNRSRSRRRYSSSPDRGRSRCRHSPSPDRGRSRRRHSPSPDRGRSRQSRSRSSSSSRGRSYHRDSHRNPSYGYSHASSDFYSHHEGSKKHHSDHRRRTSRSLNDDEYSMSSSSQQSYVPMDYKFPAPPKQVPQNKTKGFSLGSGDRDSGLSVLAGAAQAAAHTSDQE